jgi:voltage-gated potassium channel Kch
MADASGACFGYSQMFWDLFRLKDWAVIGPVGVVSLLLGFWGFLAMGHSAGDSAIQTIGLIRGAGTYAFGKAPLQLVIAQYLLPATALFGGAKLLLVNVRRDMRVAMAHRARNHVIVCGLGNTGMNIVSGMHRAGKPVVVVTLDGSGAYALACERLGITVLNGNAAQTGILKLAGLLRADSIVVTTGSDSQNLEIALSIAPFLAQRARGQAKLLVEVRSDWVLQTLMDHRTAALGGEHVEFQLFNTASDAARLLLRMPAFPQAHVSKGTSPGVHVVLAGFGYTNREIARRAICSNFALPGVRAEFTVLSRDATEADGKLRGSDTNLLRLADFHFESRTFGADRPEVWPQVREFLSTRPASAVVVALQSDDDSLYAALNFRDCLDQLDHFMTPVFVRLREQYKLGSFLQHVESYRLLPHRLVPFGALEQLTSPEFLLGHELDRLARAGHEVYSSATQKDDNSVASVPWERLAERFKASSRAQADHIPIAVRAIGYRIVGGASQVELAEQDVERVAEIEHYRWCIERRSAGWTYGKTRDDILKRNPILKDWSELSEKERSSNRELARRMPTVLARANLGLARERCLTLDEIASRQGRQAVGDNTTFVVRVDPLDDRELAEAEIACANSTMRVRLAWRGPGRLAEIEQKIAGYPKLNAAVEGWTAT